MLYENEIVMLVFGFVVTLFIWRHYQQIRNIKFSKILLLGFYLLFAAWTLSSLEEIFWEKYLNILEHLCYTCSSIAIAIWIYKIFIVNIEIK